MLYVPRSSVFPTMGLMAGDVTMIVGQAPGASRFWFQGFTWRCDTLVIENPEMSTPKMPTRFHLSPLDWTTQIKSWNMGALSSASALC
jgi:hypothetical protein